MDLHRIMELTDEVLFVPEPLTINTMCFMIIANAFVMSHSFETHLPQTVSITIQNPPKQPEVLNRLKDYLNFQIPERFSYGDYSSSRRNRQIFKINRKISPKAESEQIKALTMLSFHIGYAISHITGSIRAEDYAAKCILYIALGFITFLTLITSIVVHCCGLTGLISILLLMGLAEGAIFQALRYLMIEQRLPVHESNCLGVIMSILLRGHIAIILVNLASFALMSYSEVYRIFHLFSAFALVYLISLLVFCHSGTISIPHITDESRIYSHHSIRTAITASSTLHSNTTIYSTWTELFTTQSMWNFISTALQQNRIQNFIIVQLQNSMNDWKPNLSDIICSCLKIIIPLLVMWLISILMLIFIDYFVYQNTMNASDAMKLKSLFATLVPRICSDLASCLLLNKHNNCGGFVNCTMSVIGTFYAEINLNSLDNSSSSNAGGTLKTITNDLDSLTNIIGPYVENLTGWEK